MTDSTRAVPRSTAAPAPAPLAAFLAAACRALDNGMFESLVLSKNRRTGVDPHVVRVRRIDLRGAEALSFVESHATRDVTQNLALDVGMARVATMLDAGSMPSFAHATLHASDGDLQLLVSRKGQQTLRPLKRVETGFETASEAAGIAASSPPTHDRPRPRRLSLDLPFLRELGIADERQRLVPAMARKWRQIDKFLEVLDHALDVLPASADAIEEPARALRVVDFGCGKGYLTFAVHEHLRRRFGVAPEVTGVELRSDLVALCNDVAARVGAEGLRFVEGDLRSHEPAAVDIMIALHACDTATDHAIALGVRAGASVLVCSPCCHKELRPQMTRPRLLSGLLRHGVHLGQEAEMVTDSLRALLLETCGYEAQVFEFVALEHTSKNKMILARRRDDDAAHAARARAEVSDLKSFYGIREQCLETLLNERVLLEVTEGPPGRRRGPSAPARGSERQ